MEKGSDRMKDVIKAYLDDFAARDEYFALCYENPNKSIDECLDYIITTVKQSGCSGFDDAEIYGMAVHYFQEDDPGKIDKGIRAQCVVNHHIELTEEEKAQARQKALDEITATEVKRIRDKERREKEAAKAKAEARKKELEAEGCLSLFGED